MTTAPDTTDRNQHPARSTGWSTLKIVISVIAGIAVFSVSSFIAQTDMKAGQQAAHLRATVDDTAQNLQFLYDKVHSDQKFMEVLLQMQLDSLVKTHMEADYAASLDEDAFGWFYRFLPGTQAMIQSSEYADTLNNDPVMIRVMPESMARMQVRDACKLVNAIKLGKEGEARLYSDAYKVPENFDAELQYCGADPTVYKPVFEKLHEQALKDDAAFSAGLDSGSNKT